VRYRTLTKLYPLYLESEAVLLVEQFLSIPLVAVKRRQHKKLGEEKLRRSPP
jgi:hypothetical protein